MFSKIDVLKNFANFTEKQFCLSHFFSKVAGTKAGNFIKKKLQHSFQNTFFHKTGCWLLILLLYLKYILSGSVPTKKKKKKKKINVSLGILATRTLIFKIFRFLFEMKVNFKCHFVCYLYK